MTQVKGWVREMVEDVTGGAPFKIGDIVKHPDGRTVIITSGQYWGTYGVSNWWTWEEVLPNGRGPQESGYGWEPPKPS